MQSPSLTEDAAAAITAPRARAASSYLLAVIAIFLVGVLYQASIPTGSDVSWLILVAERVFEGQRLYVDIIESNPPLAVFIYMPAVLIEHATGVSAEMAQLTLTTLLALSSLTAASWILRRAGAGDLVPRFLIAGAFAFMVLTRYAFSQREHLAVMLLLPMVALSVARARGIAVPVVAALLIGLAGGLGAAIKPHFALVLAMPQLPALIVARSPMPVLRAPENWSAGVVLAGVAALILFAFPAYLTTIVPMEAETYLHVRAPLLMLLVSPQFLALVAAGLVAFALRPAGAPGRAVMAFLMAAAAFALAYLLQGKGWRYQLYPALALVFIVYLAAILPQLSDLARGFLGAGRQTRWKAIAGFAGLFALAPLVTLCSFTYAISLPLVADIKAVSAHPRVFALSDDLGIGHPLTRAVGGIWAGRVCSQLIQSSAEFRLAQPGTDAATRDRMARWIDWDRDRIREAIVEGQAEVLVIDHKTFNLPALKAQRPDIARLLDGFTRTAQAGTVDLLVRRDLVAKEIATGSAGQIAGIMP